MSGVVKDFGNGTIWLVGDDGIATYLRTQADINYAFLLGANDNRNFDANPLLRITPSAPTAR